MFYRYEVGILFSRNIRFKFYPGGNDFFSFAWFLLKNSLPNWSLHSRQLFCWEVLRIALFLLISSLSVFRFLISRFSLQLSPGRFYFVFTTTFHVLLFFRDLLLKKNWHFSFASTRLRDFGLFHFLYFFISDMFSIFCFAFLCIPFIYFFSLKGTKICLMHFLLFQYLYCCLSIFFPFRVIIHHFQEFFTGDQEKEEVNSSEPLEIPMRGIIY